MLSIDRSVITDTGSALLNSGDPVNITSIKTGSGTYTSTEDIKSRTALKSTQYSYDPTSVQVDGVNRTVSGILTNYDPDTSQAIVTSDYTITEVGLFATVNSVEVLFAIGVSYDGTEVPAFTGQNKSEIIVDWVMALSGTAQVTVESPGAYATAADLNTHIDNEVFSASGVHGIRAVDDDGVVKIQVYDDGWGDVNGGHVIVDESDTAYPYRRNLKFYNSTIVDDPENNTTNIHVEGAAIMVTPPTVVVGTYTYNGQPQGPTITWATGMEDYCIITNATKTDAGSYTLTIALKNTHKMFWSDMTTADKTYSYSIGKATQTITLSSNSVTLDNNYLTANVTVSDNVGALSVSSSNTSVVLASVNSDTITLIRQGSYTTSKSATITVTAAATNNYNQQTASISVTANYLQIVSFASGTDAQIKAMIDAYYNDEITWEQMGWAVGNTRTIHLNSMTAPNPNSGNTWAAQDITIVIVAHNHHDLSTPINGHTKACITVQTREVLNNCTDQYGSIYHMYLNGDAEKDTVFTKWANLYIRTYLNNTVLNAIPSGDFKSCIKPSKHYRHTASDTSAAEQVIDTLFLPSYPEVFGNAAPDYNNYVVTSPAEGTQLSYYATSANRIKYGNNDGVSNNVSQCWWLGSPDSRHDVNGYIWLGVLYDGTLNASYGTFAAAVAPVWCM